jgi:transglutaminase-like putative cysteine protease
MKNIFLVSLLFAVFFDTYAEDPKYPAFTIPEALSKDMYAVIRHEEIKIEILDIKTSIIHEKKVLTILNGQAKQYADLLFWYTKDRKILELKIAVYDAMGKLIKKVKPSEIIDQSYVSGYSLFEDTRMKRINVAQTLYPYTVEYEVEYKDAPHHLPSFMLYTDDEIAIEKTEYAVIYPAAQKPQFKTFNLEAPKIQPLSNEKEMLSWRFENVRPEKFEKFSPAIWRVVPNAFVRPNEFSAAGYDGKADTWQNLGKWNLRLNEGRDVLSPATQQKIKEMTMGLPTTEEKVKVVYEYVQSRTRYVSIQKGIGGNQPFPASLVDETGYGDCKALSNYTVSLLKVIGIKGYYTLVNADASNQDFPVDFAGDYFNHIIVSVPNGKDTLWMECTNQQIPFGYLGDFTCDRKALMITEEGGVLVNTVRYPTELNVQSRNAEVYVDLMGDAKAKVTTTYSGLQFEDGNFLSNETSEQKKWLRNTIGIPAFDLNSFNINVKKAKLPVAKVNLDLTLNRFASVTGKRIFLTPNLMNRSKFIPEKTESRKNNIVQGTGYIDYDTIRYHLPEGIYPEFLPEPIVVKSKFGEYESRFVMEENLLIYVRRMRRNQGEFPPSAYQEMTDFYKSINKADNTKIVFLNKT